MKNAVPQTQLSELNGQEGKKHYRKNLNYSHSDKVKLIQSFAQVQLIKLDQRRSCYISNKPTLLKVIGCQQKNTAVSSI